MNIKLAVNTPEFYNPFVTEVMERITRLHKELELRTDTRAITILQGRIEELRKLLQLREEVNGRDSKK